MGTDDADGLAAENERLTEENAWLRRQLKGRDLPADDAANASELWVRPPSERPSVERRPSAVADDAHGPGVSGAWVVIGIILAIAAVWAWNNLPDDTAQFDTETILTTPTVSDLEPTREELEQGLEETREQLDATEWDLDETRSSLDEAQDTLDDLRLECRRNGGRWSDYHDRCITD